MTHDDMLAYHHDKLPRTEGDEVPPDMRMLHALASRQNCQALRKPRSHATISGLRGIMDCCKT